MCFRSDQIRCTVDGVRTAIGNIGLGLQVKSIAVVADSIQTPPPPDSSGVDLELTAAASPTRQQLLTSWFPDSVQLAAAVEAPLTEG